MNSTQQSEIQSSQDDKNRVQNNNLNTSYIYTNDIENPNIMSQSEQDLLTTQLQNQTTSKYSEQIEKSADQNLQNNSEVLQNNSFSEILKDTHLHNSDEQFQYVTLRLIDTDNNGENTDQQTLSININEKQEIKQDLSENNFLILLQQISSTTSEIEKLKKIKQLHQQINNFEDEQISKEINNDVCLELLSQIGECKTVIEQEILSVIEIFSEYGSQISESWELNQYFFHFQSSGLSKQIEKLLLQQISQENQDDKQSNSFSNILTQLFLIISFINKYKRIENELLEQFGQFYKLQIINLQQNIDKINNQNKISQDEQIKNKEFLGINLTDGIRILRSLKGLCENSQNQYYFVRKLNIHEILALLLHIRCPIELNCSQSLNIEESLSLSEFIGCIYGTIAEISWNKEDIKQFLFNKHQIFEHLSSHIISFSNKHSLHKKETQQINQNSSLQQIQDPNSQYLSVISGSLHLLWILLDDNQILCRIAESTSKLTNSLVQLVQFGRKQHSIRKQEKLSREIRYYSNLCIYWIRRYANIGMQQIIINDWKYIDIQMSCICLLGGNEEQSNKIIQNGLLSINSAIYYIRNGTSWCQSLPLVIKDLYNDIELFGGVEEIDSYQFHSLQLQNDDIKDWSENALKEIINIQKYNTNRLRNN